MSTQQELSFTYSKPNGAIIQDSQVDAWELKASRRALKNLRTLLAGQPILDLLKDQMDEADVYFKEFIEKSDGKFKESSVVIQAKDITAAQFMAWWKDCMGDLAKPEAKQKAFLDSIVPAHPEHYTVAPYDAGVVETIGEHVARVRIQLCFDLPDFVLAYADPSSDQRIPGIGTLDDGSVFFYIYHELRDSEEGCHFRLRLLFPEAAPQVFFDEHAEHLAVEFRSFIATAIAWNQKQSASN